MGFLAPPLIVLFVRMGNNPTIVEIHRNSRVSSFIGWLIAIVISAAATAPVVNLVVVLISAFLQDLSAAGIARPQIPRPNHRQCSISSAPAGDPPIRVMRTSNR